MAWNHFAGGGIAFDYPADWVVVRQPGGRYEGSIGAVIAHAPAKPPDVAHGVIAVELVTAPAGLSAADIRSYLDQLVTFAPAVRATAAKSVSTEVREGPRAATLAGLPGRTAAIVESDDSSVTREWGVSSFGGIYLAHCQWDTSYSTDEFVGETQACTRLVDTLSISDPGDAGSSPT